VKTNSYAHTRTRPFFLGIVISLLFLYSMGSTNVHAEEIIPICKDNESLQPFLVISTRYGPIEIELYDRAAPQAIRQLIRLIEGPIFNPVLMGKDKQNSSVGYYDGLTFNLTKKHLEIVTAERVPAGHFVMETEIDADSLGLDRELIENKSEAMSVMQRELLVAHRKKKKKGGVSPQLSLWIKKFKETYNPDFLIGVSRKEINESLGYVYKKGLESKPVTKGSVAS